MVMVLSVSGHREKVIGFVSPRQLKIKITSGIEVFYVK